MNEVAHRLIDGRTLDLNLVLVSSLHRQAVKIKAPLVVGAILVDDVLELLPAVDDVSFRQSVHGAVNDVEVYHTAIAVDIEANHVADGNSMW